MLISNLEEGRDQGVPYYSLLIKRYFDGKCKNISYNQIIELNVPEQCAHCNFQGVIITPLEGLI